MMENVDVTSLIPSKSSDKICSDVKTVLGRTLRPLAPAALPTLDGATSEEQERLEACENDLLSERVRRAARPSPANEYRLTAANEYRLTPANEYRVTPANEYRVTAACETAPDRCAGVDFINRKQLLPAFSQHAAGAEALWVRNVLGDSREASGVDVRAARPVRPVRPVRPPPASRDDQSWTDQSLSIGWLRTKDKPTAVKVQETARPPEVAAEPRQIIFMNFNVGEVMTRSLRLTNTSNKEVRLSLSLPKHKELLITVNGSRGLRLTGLASMDLLIEFRSQDCLSFSDELVVNVSTGCRVPVPIVCFMEPPVLHISVTDPTSSSLSLAPEHGSKYALDLGARLLGDSHCTQIHIYSSVSHVSFFAVSEDDWLNYTLQSITKTGAAQDGPFTLHPGSWRGGGCVDGLVCCQLPTPGLHAGAFRVLATMSVVRELHVIADAVVFSPKHVVVEADPKNYDITSVEDASCQYYVDLGVNVTGHSLAGTVTLVNRSPVTYTYSWLLRPWGDQYSDMFVSQVNSEAESQRSDSLTHTLMSSHSFGEDTRDSATHEVSLSVVHMSGSIPGQSESVVRISVPDVGQEPGVHRLAMLLTLENIPKESIPLEHYHLIMSCRTVETNTMCGPETRSLEVCTVEVGQLEVWWRVERLHFTLDPCHVTLLYSRRLKETTLNVHATQTNAGDGASARWLTPGLPTLTFEPGRSEPVVLPLVLPASLDERVATDVFRLQTMDGGYEAALTVRLRCLKRHLELSEPFAWRGCLPPKYRLTHDLRVRNDTYLYVPWRATVAQWLGAHGGTPCEMPTCGCTLVNPVTGALQHGDSCALHFAADTSLTEGLVIWLLAVKEDPNQAASAPGCAGRGAVVACRVLAARVVVAAMSGLCGDEYPPCEVEPNLNFIVRPTRELVRSKQSYCRLLLTNTTPIAVDLSWEEMTEDDDCIKITFIPSSFHLGSYAKLELKVLMEGVDIRPRTVLVRRLHGHNAQDAFLMFDVGVSGIKVTFDIEIEEGPILLTRTETANETEMFCLSCSESCESCACEEFDYRNPELIFFYEDEKRRFIKENICFCNKRKIFIPPGKKTLPPGQSTEPQVEIVTTPPLTELCPCVTAVKPVLPDLRPICLQFRQVPLNTVVQRWIKLTNESSLETSFRVTVRKFPWTEKKSARRLVEKVAGTLPPLLHPAPPSPPGLALWARPAAGALPPRSTVAVAVCARPMSWGLYADQILIQVDGIEPLVLDVWLEAVGLPLRFASQPRDAGDSFTLQMTTVDPTRSLRCTNDSCAPLLVLGYIFKDYSIYDESEEERLPFHVTLRFFDVPRRKCACFDEGSARSVGRFSMTYDAGESRSTDTVTVMVTGIEVCLLPNYGSVVDPCFQLEPQSMIMEPGQSTSWKVSLLDARDKTPAAPSTLWMRVIPVEPEGYGWFRPELGVRVQLHHLVKTACLQLLRRSVTVRYCAHSLPCDDVLRIRKTFQVSNPGDGPLTCWLSTKHPWSLVTVKPSPFGALYLPELTRSTTLDLKLESGTTEQVCVEVEINTEAVWPRARDSDSEAQYEHYKESVTYLYFSDAEGVIMSMPLTLLLEYPSLSIEPATVDFGTVTHGDWRKTYYTVRHNSPTATIALHVSVSGDGSFRAAPAHLRLRPRSAARIYLLFHAQWQPNKPYSEATVHVRGVRAAAAAGARAALTRDFEFHAPVHDHTDDGALLPVVEKRGF